jgi:hypothetical protein
MHDILSYLTRNTYGRLTSNYNVFNNEDTNENDKTNKSKINCKIKKENTLKKDKHYIYYTKEELFDIIGSCNIDEKYKLVDIWEKIYEFIKLPEPEFKVGERCIRMYFDNINGIKKYKEQTISIWACNKNKYHPEKGYHYEYMYYPASEGFAYEINIRKLTEIEKTKSIWTLPMSMAPPINY